MTLVAAVSGIADGEGEANATVAAKSPADFRVVYDENVDFVWRNLRRLGVATCDLDDRTQEVFVVAFRRWTTFEERGFGVRAWLYQILLRIVSEARRHTRRHPEDATDDFGAVRNESSTPAELAERREDLATLDRALAALEVGRRAVIVLHEIEEMSAPAIAAILGIPVNTVYSRLRVARAELELHLRGQRREASGALNAAPSVRGEEVGR